MNLEKLIKRVLDDDLTIYNQDTGKLCKVCNTLKGINEFYYDKHKLKRSTYCKECTDKLWKGDLKK